MQNVGGGGSERIAYDFVLMCYNVNHQDAILS